MSGIFLVVALAVMVVLFAIAWSKLEEERRHSARLAAAVDHNARLVEQTRADLRDASAAAAADRAEVERLGLLLIEHRVCPDLLAAQDQALALVAPVADVVPMRGES